MNKKLVENNYIVIRNFISSYRASKLAEEFTDYAESNQLKGDSQVTSSLSSYNYISFLELLCEKTPEVSEILEEKVLPTYAYSRVYKKDSILDCHTDRESCEISLTVHLSGDKSWDIWIETPDGEQRSVSLNPGDAMMYLGCTAKHWREKYDGEKYTQVFLHYVKSRGSNSDFYFDKKNRNCEDNIDSNQKLEIKDETPPLVNLEVKERKILSTQKLEEFIFVFDDVMSEELCDNILKEYNKPDEWNDTYISNKIVDKNVRNCMEINLSIPEIIEKNLEVRKTLDEQLFQSVSKCISLYREQYPRLILEKDSGYNLLKYEKGDFYIQHTDSYVHEPRTISCSLQLNDDYLGGEFAFFDRQIMIRNKKGSVIMFPSSFMYPHEVMPVTEGARYSIVTWLL